jgi:peptide/nickel transport system substrate-binding protein
MRNKVFFIFTLTSAAALMAAWPVAAQKSKDTLRVAFQSPIKTVDLYHDPKPESSLAGRTVYDGLVYYDEKTSKFKPLLAKSWKKTGPSSFEFELRDDVKWHDGEKFDADDVVYTVNWLTNPKTRLRTKRDYTWIGKVEKAGPHKVSITGKRNFAPAIMPEHIHGKMKKKGAFGRTSAVGTGPYKVLHVDRNKGILAERFDAYNHGGTWKPKTNIKRWEIRPIPDMGTQSAHMIAGNLDLLRASSDDQARNLTGNPNLKLTYNQGLGYTYILFDTKGRTGRKEFKDVRVRKAVLMAIDRKVLQALFAGGSTVFQPEALCYRFQQGCDYSAKLPKYDPAAAKKLLAEAGYPKGFNIEMTSFVGRTGRVAQAVAGQLREIGINVKLDRRFVGSYRKKQRQGKIELLAAGWGAGGVPDVQGTIRAFIHSPKSPRDYIGDKALLGMSRKVNSAIDPVKRKALAKKLFDRLTTQAFAAPLIASSIAFVHSKDVKVARGSYNPYGAYMTDFSWK